MLPAVPCGRQKADLHLRSHGFLRKNEGDEVEAAFADKDINFIRVNAKAAFMEKLNGRF